VLALLALAATLIPDVRGLPVGWRSFDGGFAESDPKSARHHGALSVAVTFEEVEDDFQSNGPGLLNSLPCHGWGLGDLRGTDQSRALPSRRSCAHKATGPPRIQA
jgi:hypothetical protein